MVMRFDPFREVGRVLEELEPRRLAGIPMDAYRRGDEFYAHFDLPGIDAESIELTTEKNVLAVSAERVYEPQEGDEILIAERLQGRFSRQIFLGEGLDVDGIKASYDQGVLTVTIPVAEGAKPRRVAVSGGKRPQAIETESVERPSDERR
jgi:HSP20 family protein